MSDVTVTINEDRSRYEIRSGDTLAGFALFDRAPGTIRFLHTEIDPAFQGHGIGGELAAFAVRDAAASGDTIVPLCPYIEKYLRTHDVPGAKIRWPKRPGTAGEAGGAGSTRGR